MSSETLPKGGVKIKAGSFQSMGIDKEILNGLNRMNYKTPTPVQRKALPIVFSGLDIVCMARTGSGKTCVFLLPMVQLLKKHAMVGCRGLVLSPTRELALQTSKFAKDMAKFTDLRIIDIFGGDPLDAQFDALASKPDIIIATPGRLMHLLREVPTFKLKSVKYLVFDEADRLFEMGFAEQLNEIVRQCPSERQTLLFSATLPKLLVQFSRAGLRDPQLIRLDTDIKMSQELRLGNFFIKSNDKMAAFLYIVRSIICNNPSKSSNSIKTIIFTATKHHSELIHALLERVHIKSTLIYGSMDQDLRNSNLREFKNGKIDFLVVTDVAARGIDVPLLNNVINFNFPPSPKLFVHRCGRAARQGRIGYAFSLVDTEELPYLMDVHRFLNNPVDTGYGDGPIVFDSKKKKDEKKDEKKDDSEVDEANADLDASDDDLHYDIDNDDKDTEEENQDDIIENNFENIHEVNSDDEVPENKYSNNSLRGPYTLEEMTPKMVHTGIIPQDILDEENDYLKRLLHDDDHMATLYRISENAMKQYKRTRPEASQEGLKQSKKLIKGKLLNHIHPLLMGMDPKRCNDLAIKKSEYINMLQQFRPQSTVFETGIGTGSYFTSGSNGTSGTEKQKKASEIMKNLRKVTEGALERNKKSLTMVDLNNFLVNREKDEDEEDEDDEAIHNNKHDDDNDDEDDNRSIFTVTRVKQSGKLSVMERKKLKKLGPEAFKKWKAEQDLIKSQAPDQLLKDSKENLTDENRYRDPLFYISYSGENENDYAEEALQPLSNLRSSETFGATMIDNAMNSVDPQAMEENKKRKIMRWDPKKRKFVRQTLSEMVESTKSGLKRMRSESGVNTQRSNKEQGELYEQWKKKRKREINSDDVEDDTDYRNRPNFKINTHIKSELKQVHEVKSIHKKRENLKLKNMEKGKRKQIEAANRKKKKELSGNSFSNKGGGKGKFRK